MINTVLIDLDDVLTDFGGAAQRVHNLTQEELDWVTECWQANEWTKESRELYDKYWDAIHKLGSQFWLDLEPLPWAKELLNLVESFTDDWFIVSAPARGTHSHVGKLQWIEKFGLPMDKLIPTKHKRLFAQEGVVLIDDRQKTIDTFDAEGGEGILFPSKSNQLCIHLPDPIPYITKRLEYLN